MNKLIYRFSLDTHKNGIQKTLQGFEVGDTIDRVLEISLTSNGRVVEIPENNVSAVLYVKTPEGTSLNMDVAEIDGNAFTCTLSNASLAVAGISEAQLVVFNSQGNQLFSPKFEIEILESLVTLDDDSEIDDTTFAALQQAISKVDNFEDELDGAEIESVAFKDTTHEEMQDNDYTLVFTRKDGTAKEVSGLTELMEDIRESSKGVKGDDGLTPQIFIGTVTTGAAGSNASVTEVVDEEDAEVTLNFTIPRGNTGNSGVYIGETAPTDSSVNVWLKKTNDIAVCVTEDQVEEMISTATASLPTTSTVQSMINTAIGDAIDGEY